MTENVSSKIYTKQGGAERIYASGASVNFESGSALKIAGTDVIAALATAPAGVAAGYKIARGETTLDGGNPTPAVTGLATVVACVASIKTASAPGDDPVLITVDYAGGVTAGTVNLYAWKHDGIDPTLVASTNSSAVVSWIAVGT